MKLIALPLAALLLGAPAVLAHTPPGPVLTCQGSAFFHDYIGSSQSLALAAYDGNIADCGFAPIEVGVFDPDGLPCTFLQLGPPVCGELDTGVDHPLLDYDGETEFATGGAILFVRTGDGVAEGVTACYGAPAVGHHTTTIYAVDILGFGPRFLATSDYSRPGLEETPDCGDDYVEPCDPNPPAPSTQPFPVNVVADTVTALLYTMFGPGGVACNALDNAVRFASTAVAPSGGTVGFGAGADGALTVFIEDDSDNARLPQAGHVVS